MDSSPPRYEDVVYLTNGNLYQEAAPVTAPPRVHRPTVLETVQPPVQPTVFPTVQPTVQLTVFPTVQPTVPPPVQPTVQPTLQPTVQPTVLQPIVLSPAILSHTNQEVGSARALLYFINTLTHFFLGAVVFSAFAIASNGPHNGMGYFANRNYDSDRSSFSQHIYLCVTGYMILLSQAVLSFSPHGGWAHGLTHPQKQLCYGAMQILGSSLALAGCFTKITDNYEFPIPNNGHAVTGWMAMLLTLFSLIGGVINFVHSDTISQGPYRNAHTYLFLTTLTMAFICLTTAFKESRYFNSLLTSNLSITFTVFAMAGVLFAAKYRLK